MSICSNMTPTTQSEMLTWVNPRVHIVEVASGRFGNFRGTLFDDPVRFLIRGFSQQVPYAQIQIFKQLFVQDGLLRCFRIHNILRNVFGSRSHAACVEQASAEWLT